MKKFLVAAAMCVVLAGAYYAFDRWQVRVAVRELMAAQEDRETAARRADMALHSTQFRIDRQKAFDQIDKCEADPACSKRLDDAIKRASKEVR